MKIRTLAILIFYLLSMTSLKAQVVDVLDSAYLKVAYDYSRQYNPTRPQPLKDELILAIGNRYSVFYSPNTFQKDTLTATKEGKERWHKMFRESFKKGVVLFTKYGTYTYKNFSEHKTLVRDKISIENFVYDDALHDQNWNLEDSTKVVLGYECQLATSNYRERMWSVWYCPEIPINNGPWQLGGLPGLILEAYDDKGLYHFTAIGLEKVNKEPIYFVPNPRMKELIKTTREDFLKAEMSMYDHPMSTIEAQTGIKLGEDQPKTEIFEPIELL